MDHRSPEFGELGHAALGAMKSVFKTSNPVIICPASRSGAREAALANTLSPGDKVLMCETGNFAMMWQKPARKLGLEPVVIETDRRAGADVDAIRDHLAKDKALETKAVCVVHNETSTGCASGIAKVRSVMDAVNHPALYMVDTISSLASVDYRHGDRGVDVTVGGSQKRLTLPP